MSVGDSSPPHRGRGTGWEYPPLSGGIPVHQRLLRLPLQAREPGPAPWEKGNSPCARVGGGIPHPPTIISCLLTFPAQIQYLPPDSHLDPRLLLLQVIGRASLGCGGEGMGRPNFPLPHPEHTPRPVTPALRPLPAVF